MLNKKCAIALLARDCEKNLSKNIIQIDKLSKSFSICDICVVENDSIDNTKNILFSWIQRNKQVSVLTFDNEFKSGGNIGANITRIERMCFYRNKYMEYFREINKDYDFLMVIDSDLDFFSSENILKSIENAPNDWDAIFANGRYYFSFFGQKIITNYYDLYALNFQQGFHKNIELLNLIESQFKMNEYIKCLSAFGGIGVYNWSKVKDFKYSTELLKDGSSVCEHKSFNSKLTNCYISKEMLAYYTRINFFHGLYSKIITPNFKIKLQRLKK